MPSQWKLNISCISLRRNSKESWFWKLSSTLNQIKMPTHKQKKYSCFSSLTQTRISQNSCNRHIPPLNYLPTPLSIGNRTELYCFLRFLCYVFSIFWQNHFFGVYSLVFNLKSTHTFCVLFPLKLSQPVWIQPCYCWFSSTAIHAKG